MGVRRSGPRSGLTKRATRASTDYKEDLRLQTEQCSQPSKIGNSIQRWSTITLAALRLNCRSTSNISARARCDPNLLVLLRLHMYFDKIRELPLGVSPQYARRRKRE